MSSYPGKKVQSMDAKSQSPSSSAGVLSPPLTYTSNKQQTNNHTATTSCTIHCVAPESVFQLYSIAKLPPSNNDSTMSHLPRSHSSAGASSRLSTVPSQKPRQISHLQSQLAQLTANMADLEQVVRMAADQARDMRGLGGYAGAM